jgi:hypothetical protein
VLIRIYGHVTSPPLTLKGGHRVRVLGSRVLSSWTCDGRDKRGEWRRLYNDELNDLYTSPNIMLVMKSRVACGTFGGEKRCIQGFGGETLGKEGTWKTWA